MANNFVFADAIPAQQYVSMAQIAAAQDAERKRQQSETLRSLVTAQVARENAAAERARNESYLSQSERESARADATRNKDLDLRRIAEENYRKAFEADRGAVTADKEKAARVRAQIATLTQIASDPTDPPPPTEWATNKARYGADLSKSEIDALDIEWGKTRKLAESHRTAAAGDAAGYTAKLRAALSTITNDPKGTTRQSKIDAIQKEIADAKQHGYIVFDPASGGFVSRLSRLREDPPKGPGTAPQDIPPATDAQPRVRSLFDVPRPVPPTGYGGFGGFINPEIAGGLSVGEPPIQRFTPPHDQRFIPPLSAGPAPLQQPVLRSWQPQSFIPNTGSVGYYPPPPTRTFEPMPQIPQWAIMDAAPDPAPQPRSIPPWLYSPIFGRNGLLGPTGLAGQGVFGQQPAQIAPPPFVPPQYLSTDAQPRGMQSFVPPPMTYAPPRQMLSPYNY